MKREALRERSHTRTHMAFAFVLLYLNDKIQFIPDPLALELLLNGARREEATSIAHHLNPISPEPGSCPATWSPYNRCTARTPAPSADPDDSSWRPP